MGQEISAVRRAAASEVRKLKSCLAHLPDADEPPDQMVQGDFPKVAEVVAVASTCCLDHDCLTVPGLDCDCCAFGTSNSEQQQAH